MATTADVVQAISEIGGIPEPTVKNIARRLGEGGLLPRGGRGRALLPLTSRHCTSLLVGAMRIADGIDGVAARIDQAVVETEALFFGEEASAFIAEESGHEHIGTPILTPGTFAEQVAGLIERLARGDKDVMKQVNAIGITHDAYKLYGWIETVAGTQATVQGTCVVFEDKEIVRYCFVSASTAATWGNDPIGQMEREVKIGMNALSRIAELFRQEGH